jgi:hypothetical protein
MARPAVRATRSSHRRARARNATARCPHDLLVGTCAICLQIEENTADDLHPSRLAPEERPARARNEDEESEEEAEEEE